VKIALLSDCYLPRLGGIEVQVHDLARRLQGRGHDVEVFTATPGPQGERGGFVDEVDGVAVHRMALRLPFDLPVNPLAPPELRRRLREGGFDVAHVHTGVVSPFAFDSARVALAAGVPTAMTWHCVLARTETFFRLAGYVRRWAARGVAMSAVSAMAAEPLQRMVGDAGEVAVLPNGIDVAEWAPAGDASRRGRADGIRMVSAMRLATRKRPMPLLRIMTRVRELVPARTSLSLDLLGEGPDRARLERYVAGHDMSAWVRMPGRVSREELRATYAGSHLYLAPTVLESFGIATLEARTAGLPVVARHGSGVEEFVQDGVSGLLADGDEAMAGCIARLAVDDDLRERLTRHNETVPPAQSWEHVVEVAEGEYARAGAARRPVR
jgi:glycosyltransferase involved in cell wall biosynthesis